MIALFLVTIVCAFMSIVLSVVGVARDSRLCVAIACALAAVAVVLSLVGMILGTPA